MFSSGRQQSVGVDTLPWEWIGQTSGLSGGRCAVDVPADCSHAYRGVYAPRPQFTRPLTNAVNPVLTEFRLIMGGEPDLLEIAELWVDYELDGDAYNAVTHQYTVDQIDHARRVLARLVALHKESETT